MKIAGIYSFKNGKEILEKQYPSELGEIEQIIALIDESHQTNSRRTSYKIDTLNRGFKQEFYARNWQSHKIFCEYPTEFYTQDYHRPEIFAATFREIDFVKNRVGASILIGKYASMVYNICAKMTIFHNQDIIDVGVEIVPIKELAYKMSSGVSYFEQFVWDLEQRGVADIDIPVLILGITI
jgi:hypothetical protein